ncbi:alpha/beta hydrolase family protein [Alteromonas lipolytica]|uniref:AB hydrolase-1 domain-containing protein n=1 Tax=Alteromonas lipolytica TaxID=1856405 RepID=A0A1E8FBS9_9ALTE|nr:hypothetical protein [Alteromonas lipolytica]OFI33382.1 hypothetical protein BFC17_03725 [Alteromonas lipolytica]GGF60232.1 hypothetical protein GCM10011338_10570 [Alteromonas lipolytica]
MRTLAILTKAVWLRLASITLTLFMLGCSHASELTVEQLTVADRQVKVWHWQPDGKPAATLIFSHGAASAPLKYTALIEPWVAAGYEVVAPLHVDSTDHPDMEKYQGMASWTARLQDMQLLADTYGKNGYVAAGHSYGALIALVKGGATGIVPPGLAAPLSDSRVSAVLAFSPPGAIPGFVSKDNYATLAVPALIQTGTKDVPPGTNLSWEGHLDAYSAVASGGDRYALILDDVDHYFGGAICRLDLPGPKQQAQLDQAIEYSLLMLQAYANKETSAKQQLTQKLGKTKFADLQYK